MDGRKADMVFTDPLYGMNLDTDFSKMKSKNEGSGNVYSEVIGDDIAFDPTVFFVYFDYCREQFWFGADYYVEYLLKGGSWVVWDKRESADTGKNVDARIGSKFELCWSMSKHQRDIARIMWAGMFGVKDDSKRCHPTQKPVQLAEWFFDKWGKGKSVVADPFLGSGSTLIACEKTNRKCYGMELEPKYCDVIIKRWKDFTGGKAEKI